MRRFLPSLLVLVLLPAAASAQKRTIHVSYSRGEYYGNRFSLEPYAGATKDPYDISPDDSNTSPLFGFRVGYRLGGRTRLIGNIGYTKSENVSDPQTLPSYYVYDNTWVFTTAGAEFDVVPGRTSASLGLQGGAAWRRIDLDGSVGSPVGPTQEDRGFHATTVVIPSIALRHRFTSRIGAFASVHDNMYLDGPVEHGVGVSVGVALR